MEGSSNANKKSSSVPKKGMKPTEGKKGAIKDPSESCKEEEEASLLVKRTRT